MLKSLLISLTVLHELLRDPSVPCWLLLGRQRPTGQVTVKVWTVLGVTCGIRSPDVKCFGKNLMEVCITDQHLTALFNLPL